MLGCFISFSSLDSLLGGGYKRGEIFEIAGPSGVGKTQVSDGNDYFSTWFDSIYDLTSPSLFIIVMSSCNCIKFNDLSNKFKNYVYFLFKFCIY